MQLVERHVLAGAARLLVLFHGALPAFNHSGQATISSG
jgi:hypothetical protein